jgi:hypothetical protein
MSKTGRDTWSLTNTTDLEIEPTSSCHLWLNGDAVKEVKKSLFMTSQSTDKGKE